MLVDVVDQDNEVRARLAKVLETVIQEMTSCPTGVEVSFSTGEKTTVYKVTLPQEFRGKLIGAQGKNITSCAISLALWRGITAFALSLNWLFNFLFQII